MEAQETTLHVWCTYPIEGIYTLPWRLLMWASFLAVVLRTLSGVTDWVYSVSTSFVILCLLLVSGMGLFTRFLPDVNHDANAVVLPVILLTAIYAMLAVLIFSRRFFTHPWVPRTIRGATIVCLVFCICIADLPSRILSSTTLYSLSCGGNVLCQNPCSGIQKSKYRGSAEHLQPVIWFSSDSSILGTVASDEDWVKNANRLDAVGYNFLLSMRYWYLILGLVFYTASIALRIRPKEGRDIVFQSLQESLRPRFMDDSSLKSRLDLVGAKLRYVYVAVLALSLPLQLFEMLFLFLMRCMGRQRPRNALSKYISTIHETPARYYIGKSLAVLWYFWALSFQGSLPVAAIYLIVKSEISFRWIPNLEDNQPLSLKVPLCYLVFVLLVAVIPATYNKWKNKGVPKHYLSNKPDKGNSGNVDDLFYMKAELSRSELPFHMQIVANIMYEWRDFIHWWDDPRKASRQHSGLLGRDLESKDLDISTWTIPMENIVPSSSATRTLHRQPSMTTQEDLEKQ